MGEKIEFVADISFNGSIDEFHKLVKVFSALGPSTVMIDTVPLPERPAIWGNGTAGDPPFPQMLIGPEFMKQLIEGTPRVEIDGIRGGIRNPHLHIRDGEVAFLDRARFQTRLLGRIAVKTKPQAMAENVNFHGRIRFGGDMAEFEELVGMLGRFDPGILMINTVPLPDKPTVFFDPRYGGWPVPQLLVNPGFEKVLTDETSRFKVFPFPGGIRNPHLHLKDGGVAFINRNRFRELMGDIIVEMKNIG